MILSPPPIGSPGDPEEDLPEPPHLRRLRLLVSTLTIVMILGMVAIVAILVIRLGGFGGASVLTATTVPVTAEEFTLPAGHAITAIGRGAGHVLMVTRDAEGGEHLLSFHPATAELVSRAIITRE